MITGEKTKQQCRTFYILAGEIILFNPLRAPTPFTLLLFLLKPTSRVIRGQEIVTLREMQRLLNKRQGTVGAP